MQQELPVSSHNKRTIVFTISSKDAFDRLQEKRKSSFTAMAAVTKIKPILRMGGGLPDKSIETNLGLCLAPK